MQEYRALKDVFWFSRYSLLRGNRGFPWEWKDNELQILLLFINEYCTAGMAGCALTRHWFCWESVPEAHCGCWLIALPSCKRSGSRALNRKALLCMDCSAQPAQKSREQRLRCWGKFCIFLKICFLLKLKQNSMLKCPTKAQFSTPQNHFKSKRFDWLKTFNFIM